MTDMPEEIYALQSDAANSWTRLPWNNKETPYIRKDIHDKLKAENERMKKHLKVSDTTYEPQQKD